MPSEKFVKDQYGDKMVTAKFAYCEKNHGINRINRINWINVGYITNIAKIAAKITIFVNAWCVNYPQAKSPHKGAI